MNFKGRDVISIEDFSLDEIEHILNVTKEVEMYPEKFKNEMAGKIMSPLFFENSTRTSSSFQAAMLQMGGRVLDFDIATSSVNKGETLRDTVKIIEGYNPDFVIIRHKRDGSAKFVADLLDVPVMNAGDGQNQHPTQTLLDLYTIKELRGSLDGTKIVLAGDLKYGRTVHSLALALSKYPRCEMVFISPDSLRMPKYILNELSKKGVSFQEKGLEELELSIRSFPIIYMTRIQRERFPESLEGEQEYEVISKVYRLSLEMLKNVNHELKIMHPLPKVGEIEESVDETNFAHYFQQAKNGLYIRKALLILLAGGKDE
ncbi:MAG: aspartate carbamoyltransferase [Nanoarchaeota archaeon]|nr:aspartate carbamoyltransferase [Nanoarchaeota archaeon]